MKDLTKYFIDLSRCTEEEQKYIFSLLPKAEFDNQYRIDDRHFRLSFDENDLWWVYNDKKGVNKTELTYPEFIRLFENGSLSLQTKLEMFYDFLYERGVAKQLGVGIDTIVKHFIDEKLLSNDR